MLKSKVLAWIALVLVVLLIGFTFSMRPVWWAFADLFFAFMMVFSHLLAIYLGKINTYIGRRLDFFALIFGILTIIAFVVEYFLLQNLN